MENNISDKGRFLIEEIFKNDNEESLKVILKELNVTLEDIETFINENYNSEEKEEILKELNLIKNKL